MNIFLTIILPIICVLIIAFIIIYYIKIKKTRQVSIPLNGDCLYSDLNSITIVTRSVLTLILIIVNKITKQNYTAITNPLNHRVHFVEEFTYDNCDHNFNIIAHEYVHLVQVKYTGKIKFLFKYLLYWIKNKFSYYDIPYEKIAYKLEEDFSKGKSYISLQNKTVEECENLK